MHRRNDRYQEIEALYDQSKHLTTIAAALAVVVAAVSGQAYISISFIMASVVSSLTASVTLALLRTGTTRASERIMIYELALFFISFITLLVGLILAVM